METCSGNNHSYKRFGFSKDGVLYYCSNCKSIITRPFDEHIWAMRKPEPFDTEYVIEIIDKSNIDEVNDCKEIYEACTPQEIEEYMKDKYPVEANLTFFHENKSEFSVVQLYKLYNAFIFSL